MQLLRVLWRPSPYFILPRWRIRCLEGGRGVLSPNGRSGQHRSGNRKHRSTYPGGDKMTKWKFLGVLVATIAFCSSGMAQNYKAFLGIWQLDKEKNPNSTQQSQMVIN